MRPERLLIRGLAVWFALSLAAAFWAPIVPLSLIAAATLAGAAAIDAIRGRRLPPIEVERIAPHALALRNWTPVTLRLHSPGGRRLDLEVHDHHPTNGETTGLPARVTLLPGSGTELRYRFRPLSRGTWSFAPVEVLLRSPWRLWRLRRRIGGPTQVRVYPDFRSVQRFAILAVDNAVSQLGVRRRQRRGEGLELRQLREYREGDALRQIDWKATSRRMRVISREYEDERNQQVVFLLDCGWKMRAVDDGEAHFDHALNSVLLLTYVAVRQGDAVGLMTLGGPERWLQPQKGPAAMRSVLDAVYDLEPQNSAPDYSEAATRLMARQRRRALVVIVSNVRDEDVDEAVTAARLLRRRHLVLLASLREAALDRALEQPVENLAGALRTSATHHYLLARRKAHERLRSRGVLTLDVTPEQLPLSVVNRYLDIKRSGAL